MPRDVDPAADPDAVVLQDVVERRGERPGASRPARQARMEAHRHQRRRLGALVIQLIERRLEIGFEVRG